MDEAGAENNTQAPKKKKSEILDTAKFILISLLAIIAFRYYIAQPFIVSGESMVPTFLDGEYLIVDELSYRFEEPSRGDVIILKYPLNPKKFFIKRIVGLPGEKVEIRGSAITIYQKNGEKAVLSEPYVENTRNDFIDVTLRENEYYVLGDNRAASSDSRIWGPLPKENVVGRPFVRLFPFSRLSWFPGK